MSERKKMKKENVAKIIILIILLLLMIFVIKINKKEATINTNAGVISNNKIEWGIKRNNNNKQPDLGKLNKELIDKVDGISMGNNEKKYIYLTFDNGYEAGYTDDILNTLKNNNVTATFFVTAHYINTTEELVRKMIDNGNIIANHTVNHKSMPSLDESALKEEVIKLHESVKQKFNYEMKYIRPPKGEYSEKSLTLSKELGYKTVMWSFAYSDWDEKKQPSQEEAKKKIIDNLHNGEVMLLHATSRTNKDILDSVIKEIKAKGYEFKSIDEFEK